MDISIGTRIKNARNNKGITLKELGNRIGISESNMQKHEAGNVKGLTTDRMICIANELDVSPAYLMGWEDPEQEHITDTESTLIGNYRSLNDSGQEKLIEYSDDLVTSGKYRPSTYDPHMAIAAHADDRSEEQMRLIREDLDDL